MIHQLIFAAPRPGMSEAEFQDYWLNVHAVRYASKIPQIKKYMVDTRVPVGEQDKDPLWSGVAEIWLASEEEQLASLQSKEFLEGARQDEPRWAAFWRTVALDTDAHELLPGPPLTRDPTWIKLLLLVKRRGGMPLADFRNRSLREYGEQMLAVPGLRRYLQCHVRDGLYAVGEAVLDAVYQCWFEDAGALSAALDSVEFKRASEDLQGLVEPRYVHAMTVSEHWIIGPESR